MILCLHKVSFQLHRIFFFHHTSLKPKACMCVCKETAMYFRTPYMDSYKTIVIPFYELVA